jgi:hypothetical protein
MMVVAACAHAPEPFDYQSERELKPGPGLFTGKEGMWTIVGPPATAKPEAPADEDGEAASGTKPDGEEGSAPPHEGAE